MIMQDKYKVKFGDQSVIVEVEKIGGDDPVIVTPPPIDTSGFKIGCNLFPWTPLRLLDSIGMKWARCYCSSGWIWQPGGLAVQPMHQAETQENHGTDEMLLKAKGLGINTLLCIHQTPEWFRNTGRGDGNNDYAPIKSGAKRDDPASFSDYAAFLFQVAARYGRVNHPDNFLRVDTTPRWSGDILNEKKTGMDLLTHMEPWNEEKWWKKGTTENEAYIEPETMAALMSACYDGHEGKLGAAVGIKTADPSMQVVMPGLSDFDMAYSVKMDVWFTVNRKDRSWPCDILNYHHYSNTGNKKGQIPAQWHSEGACLPKDDANFQAVKELVTPKGKKVWVTEFGADKVAPSMMLAKGFGAKSNEQFQAEIIIESIKAYKAAGVDGVFVFAGPDDYGAADGGQFETCGIWSSEVTGYKPFQSAIDLKAYLAAPKHQIESAKHYKKSDNHGMIKAGAGKRPFKNN